MLIRIEPEVRHKAAGLRAYTQAGMGPALFMPVSKYGFNDILDPGPVALNPGEMAGQVITGIGFLGGGIIFVRRERPRHHHRRQHLGGRRDWRGCRSRPVRSSRWQERSPAVILLGFAPITNRLRQADEVVGDLVLTYGHGTGVLRQAMTELTEAG